MPPKGRLFPLGRIKGEFELLRCLIKGRVYTPGRVKGEVVDLGGLKIKFQLLLDPKVNFLFKKVSLSSKLVIVEDLPESF